METGFDFVAINHFKNYLISRIVAGSIKTPECES